MFVVGLTGGIGSGKSEVSRRFEMLGITVIDADIVAREIVEPNTTAIQSIENHFGKAILNADGTLNRARLRQIIFSNPEEKKWLENLLHPIIRQEIIKQLKQVTSPYTILSSPLLLETTQHTLTNRILVVDASEKLQLARASDRDINNPEQIKAIMATQLSRVERCAKANDIIDNNENLAKLDSQITQLHKTYLALAEKND